MPVGTGIALAGAGVAGGIFSAVGASKQAKAAEQSTAAAIAEQRRQFDINRQMIQPWVSSGGAAVQRLAFLLGLNTGAGAPSPAFGGSNIAANRQSLQERIRGLRNIGIAPLEGGVGPGVDLTDFLTTQEQPAAGAPAGAVPGGEFGSLMRDFSAADFEADPGYAFRVSEGMKALERSAAARGGLFGGGTLRGITRYGQEMGSQEYMNAYNRFQQNRGTRYNFLANLAGLGQSSAGQLLSAGQANAQNIGNLMVGGATSAAAARASGYGALGASIANAPLNYFYLQQLGRQ